MYVCSKCNHKSEQQINFCPLCGGAVIAEEQPQPVVVAAQPVAKPQVRRGPMLAKKIVSVALSGVSLVYAVIAPFYVGYISVFSLFATGMGVYADTLIMTGFMPIYVASIFLAAILGFAIPALVLASSCIRQGDRSAMSITGRTLSIVAIILGVACFLWGLFCLVLAIMGAMAVL